MESGERPTASEEELVRKTREGNPKEVFPQKRGKE